MGSMPNDRFYLAADAVVFTIIDEQLMILLIERKNEPFKGRFALPGGFVELDEELEHAASRELEEETNVKDIFLKKLGVYGKVGRDPRGRVISVAFLALIDGRKVRLAASTDAAMARWHPAYGLPKLAFDHKDIIDDALTDLRQSLAETDIARQIMPEKFTLSDLQKAFEIILGKALDKRNFRKKLKETKVLQDLHETRMQGAHRPAALYGFR